MWRLMSAAERARTSSRSSDELTSSPISASVFSTSAEISDLSVVAASFLSAVRGAFVAAVSGLSSAAVSDFTAAAVTYVAAVWGLSAAAFSVAVASVFSWSGFMNSQHYSRRKTGEAEDKQAYKHANGMWPASRWS